VSRYALVIQIVPPFRCIRRRERLLGPAVHTAGRNYPFIRHKFR
jgi:hypothetical protein